MVLVERRRNAHDSDVMLRVNPRQWLSCKARASKIAHVPSSSIVYMVTDAIDFN